MLNQITLIGRLVRDPELKQVGGENTSVVNISLAVDRQYNKDQAEKQTDFIPVTAWRTTAEFIARNFRKGQQVYVSGRLETRSWEKDGVKQYGFTVMAREVGFADSKKPGGNGANQNTGTETDFPQNTGLDEFGSMDGFENIPADSDPFGGFEADPFAGTPFPSDTLPN